MATPKYARDVTSTDHNPYALARRYGDRVSWPANLPREVAEAKGLQVRTAADDVEELAVAAGLAYHLSHSLANLINRALENGATVEQVSEAVGLEPAALGAYWLRWAEGQRWLVTQYPDLPDDTGGYRHTAELLGVQLSENPAMPAPHTWLGS